MVGKIGRQLCLFADNTWEHYRFHRPGMVYQIEIHVYTIYKVYRCINRYIHIGMPAITVTKQSLARPITLHLLMSTMFTAKQLYCISKDSSPHRCWIGLAWIGFVCCTYIQHQLQPLQLTTTVNLLHVLVDQELRLKGLPLLVNILLSPLKHLCSVHLLPLPIRLRILFLSYLKNKKILDVGKVQLLPIGNVLFWLSVNLTSVIMKSNLCPNGKSKLWLLADSTCGN